MVLVDTNILVAAGNRRDNRHRPAAELISSLPSDERLVASTVLAEASYLLQTQGGSRAEVHFLYDFAAGDFRLAELLPSDLGRIAALVDRYSDLGLGGTDASVIAIAERMGIDMIATFDRRHFTVVRPNHVDAFTLLP